MAKLQTAAFQSQSFQDTLDKMDQVFADGPPPTEEEIDIAAQHFGYDPTSFKDEYRNYSKALDAGEQIEQGGTFLGRILGRGVGELVGGLGNFGKDLFLSDSMAEDVEREIDNLADILPEDLRKEMIEVFDPYHGEGLAGGAENAVGHIISYLVPYAGTMKTASGISNFAKTMHGARRQKKLDEFLEMVEKISPQSKNKRITFQPGTARKADPKITQPKGDAPWLEPMTPATGTALVPITQSAKKVAEEVPKVLSRSERFGKRLGTGLKHGTGFAVGATMVEDPEENLVNILVETFPEAMDFIEPLAVNPDDSKARQYGQAFVNNMLAVPAFEAVFAPFYLRAGKPGIEAIASAANRMDKSSIISDDVPVVGLLERLRIPLRNWSSTKGTDADTLALTIRRDGAGREAVTLTESIGQSLKQAMKSTYGSKANDPKVLETINDALAGATKENSDVKIMDDLIGNDETKEVGLLVKEMRDSIDNLSNIVGSRLRTGKMKAKIDKNLGTYINRSYRAFDDPSWRGLDSLKKKVGEEKFNKIKSDAETYLREQVGIANKDMEPVLKYIAAGMKPTEATKLVTKKNWVGENPDQFVSRLAEFARGSTKPFSKRKYQPPELRALWGEYKDPYKNFGKTFEKLSVLKAEQDYLNEMKRVLTRKRVDRAGREVAPLATRGTLNPKQVTEAGDPVYISPSDDLFDLGKAIDDRIGLSGREAVKSFDNPLRGLFVDKAYEDIIKNGLDLAAPSAPWIRHWIKMKATSQIMKTVASPATHGRNVMGNNVMMVANGFLPYGRGQAAFLSKRILGKNDREFAKEIGELQRLGVIDSDVRAETVRASLRDMVKDGYDNTVTRIMDKATLGIPKTIAKKTMQLYRDEDNMFKLVHFNKTKDYLEKAYKNELKSGAMSRDRLMELAAERTRNLMPNYNLVNKRLKQLRRAPIGDFLSFPAEMIRTTLNLGKYTLRDIKSGNPVLMRQGFKRLGGMTVAGLGGDIAVRQSMNLFGITPEQDKAIDEAGASYNKNVPRVYLSPINRDKNNRLGVDFINLGPIDPYDYIKYIARATSEAALSEEEPDWGVLGLGLWDKAMGPFVGPSMITEAALKLANKDFDPLQPGIWEQALLTTVGPFEPGFVPLLSKRLQYERSLKERQEFGLGAVGKYGNTLTEDQVALWPNLAGLQTQRLDLTTALGKKLPALARQVQGSRKAFKDSPAYKDQTQNSPEDLLEAYLSSQDIKVREYKRLKKAADAFNILTDGDPLSPSSEDYFRGITQDGKYKVNNAIQKIIQNAWDNRFMPDVLTDEDFRFLRNTGKTVPIQDIEELYRLYESTKIKGD
tara:strand:+ start:196 stop:4173 length:3978 start_codon:yes stop_codon:yes gene_type:complete